MRANQIKSLRSKLKLSQPEFYDQLGLDPTTPTASKKQFIRRMEKGDHKPSKSTTALLAILKLNRGIS